MFFDKPIHDLTFEDVVEFCKRQIPEGKQLDYKYLLPKNKEKFAKVIASFANALGGTVIIGVNDDKNDKPRPPFTGIAYHEKIRNTIEDIIQVYIDPVVFVDVNICVSKDGQRMFVVIHIPQSNLTPHLVGKLKRAYIRTGQSSRPEAIVHPTRLPWLLDHRQKSERLRHILYDKAESHFENYLKNKQVSHSDWSVMTLSLVPLYPEEPLMPYRQLPAYVRPLLSAWPTAAAMQLQPVQDGVATIDVTAPYRMIEFNSYGLLMAKWNAARPLMISSMTSHTVDLAELIENIIHFFYGAIHFLQKLSFAGPLDFRLKMNNTRGLHTSFRSHQAHALEDYIRLDENYNLPQLTSQFAMIVQNIAQTTAWSLGLQISDEEIQTFIKNTIQRYYEK